MFHSNFQFRRWNQSQSKPFSTSSNEISNHSDQICVEQARYIPNKFPNISDEQELVKLRGYISCEKPNKRLYEFKGKIVVDGIQ